MSLKDEIAQHGPPNLASWWIWCSWQRRGDAAYFVYGCAAQTSREPSWSKDASIDLGENGQLEIRQRTLTDSAFGGFQDRLNDGSIALDLVANDGAPSVSIKESRLVIQRALGQTSARVRTYYSLPDVVKLVGEADGALEELLSLLERELNLPFKSSHAGRLGNFEIFHLNPWLDAPQPFLIESASPPPVASGPPFRIDRSRPETLEVCRTPIFAQDGHWAHIAGRVQGDTVIDRLVFLEPGQVRVAVESPEWLDQLDFRLFDETGKTLLHSQQDTYITTVPFVLAPITRQITIEDDLSGRAAQKGLGQQASIVNAHTSIRSVVGGPPDGSWQKFAQDMQDRVAAHLPKPSQDRWFPRGIEGEVGAIAHFNHLLAGGQIKRAILVDPWFGADALRAFALRLGSQDIQLTIVTSWTRRNPDTGVAFGLSQDPTADIEATLRQVANFLNPRLTVINLADGTDQAFHDRYLLLYPHEGASQIYLLSNSLNRAAGNWPFCISLLAADVGFEVRRYIEGLCNGQDVARGKSLKITYQWPSNAV